tara:strand:- start:2449 stop:3666 length:1218 start_codon:yes stop_codon:yes gene_type:complete
MLCLSASAHAQNDMFSRDQNVSVLERPRPEYDSQGVRLGSWDLRPSLGASVVYSDNVLATQSNKQSDLITRISPNVSLSSDWGRHSLGGSVGIVSRFYAESDGEDSTDFIASVGGGLDITQGASSYFRAEYFDGTEERGASRFAASTTEPIEYSIVSGEIGGAYVRSQVRFQGFVRSDNFDFEDGLTDTGLVVDQDNRDRSDTTVQARADYALSPDTSFLIRVETVNVSYDSNLGVDRDQQQFKFDGGVDFDLSELVRGLIALGYFENSPDDSSLAVSSGLNVDANVEWFLSPITTATFSASRTTRASSLSGGTSATSEQFEARIDHELLRNLLLRASASVADSSFQNIDRSDSRTSLSFGGTYLLNRSVALNLNLSSSELNSSGLQSQPDFVDNRITFGVTLRR